jgi:hypothetical protein
LKATKKIKRVKKPSPPLRTSQGTWARNVKKAHTFAEHLAKVSQQHPSENEPKEDLLNFWRPPINSNHQSIASKELKFKKSSTA